MAEPTKAASPGDGATKEKKPKKHSITKEQKEALKRQFELHKAGKGMLPLAKVRKCIERANIIIREEELSRMINWLISCVTTKIF